MNQFSLKDYGIPYGYSPLIIAKSAEIESKNEAFKNFTITTKKGYLFAQNNPEKAVEILSKYIPERDLANIDILKSQTYLNQYYGNINTIGKMEASVFQTFIDWLFEHDILEKRLVADEILLIY